MPGASDYVTRRRQKAMVYWMVTLFSMAVLQYILPISMIVSPSSLLADPTTSRPAPSPLSRTQAVDLRQAIAAKRPPPPVLVNFLIPVFQPGYETERTLEYMTMKLEGRCPKGGPIIVMVYNASVSGSYNSEWEQHHRDYEFRSRCMSFISKGTKTREFAGVYEDPVADAIWSSARYKPDYHIVLWEDGQLPCDSAIDVLVAAATKLRSQRYGVVRVGPGLPGTLINRFIAVELADAIASAPEGTNRLAAIGKFVADRRLPSYMATKSLISPVIRP